MQAAREDMERDFEAWRGCAPLHHSMAFTEAGLLLGRARFWLRSKRASGGAILSNAGAPTLTSRAFSRFSREPLVPIGAAPSKRSGARAHSGARATRASRESISSLPACPASEIGRPIAFISPRKCWARAGPADILNVMGFEEAARELEKKYNRTSRAFRPAAEPKAGAGRQAAAGRCGTAHRSARRRERGRGATRSDASRPGIVPARNMRRQTRRRSFQRKPWRKS